LGGAPKPIFCVTAAIAPPYRIDSLDLEDSVDLSLCPARPSPENQPDTNTTKDLAYSGWEPS
jgi:hypothetical protein